MINTFVARKRKGKFDFSDVGNDSYPRLKRSNALCLARQRWNNTPDPKTGKGRLNRAGVTPTSPSPCLSFSPALPSKKTEIFPSQHREILLDGNWKMDRVWENGEINSWKLKCQKWNEGSVIDDPMEWNNFYNYGRGGIIYLWGIHK